MLGHRKLDVKDYLAILKRRRWIIGIPVVLGPLVALGVTFFLPARYLSQTLVIIEEQKVPDDYVRPVLASNLDSRLASMKEQIMSRSLLQPIIERYNLYQNQHLGMDDRLDLARKAINIKPIHSEIEQGGSLPGFFISFTASDPRTAQLVCGEITSLFTNENLRSREAAAEGTTDFLKSQLAEAKRNLDQQDQKLAEFQMKFGGKLPGDEEGNLNMLTSLTTQMEAANQELSRMMQERAYQESMLTQAAQQSGVTTTSSGSVVVGPYQSPELQEHERQLQGLQANEAELLNHYTADYPDVVAVHRKITDLKREIAKESAAKPPASAGGPVSAAVAQRNDSPAVQQMRAQLHAADMGIAAKKQEQAQLQQKVAEYQARLQSAPEVTEQYKDLTRDYDTAQKFYDGLLTKMNESKMATDLELRQQGEQFQVMDEPNLPDAPTFPNRPLFEAGGLLIGLLVGCGIAALLEYKDTSLRSEQDVWTFTNLPTLAVLPFAKELYDDAPRPGPIERVKKLMRFKHQKEPLAEAGS